MPGPLAIQPELLYVQKGAAAQEVAILPETGTTVLIRQDIEAAYIELPVLGTLQVCRW